MARRGRAGAPVGIALTALALCACGSGSGSNPVRSSGDSHPPSSPAHHRSSPTGPPLGTAQRVRTSGTALSVTVLRVIDPLPSSEAALPPGTRALGVVVRVVNNGSGIYDSSATGDVSVLPSSGPATPVFASHGICQTPLRDFDNYITPGEVRHGCVTFAVPAGAKVLTVRFSPHGQAAGRVSWR